MSKAKVLLGVFLLGMVVGTIGLGLYFKQYFVVFAFAVWFCVEFLLWRFPLVKSPYAVSSDIPTGGQALLRQFSASPHGSIANIEEWLNTIQYEKPLTAMESKWIEYFRALVELSHLVQSSSMGGKRSLRKAFIYRVQPNQPEQGNRWQEDWSIEDITESSGLVADLYWKLYEGCSNRIPSLTKAFRQLYFELFDEKFGKNTARSLIEELTDSIQRDRGIPYLILNLIRKGEGEGARRIAQGLLRRHESQTMDEEVRSSLYWVSEIHWFVGSQQGLISDYDSCIRHLYHLCFVNADRAGFLEIDSQFFAQFETVNELAREGFLFKELLIEKILQLWKEHEGLFDEEFRSVLESMTQLKNKILDERENWERFWKRERQEFCRDYLYVVEGNLCYASGHYEDASLYYEKALKVNPKLRSAMFNLLFCYAKLGAVERHESLVERILEDKALHPAALYVIGDSYLLLGEDERANAYYGMLERLEGWDSKIDYYKSIFCYEHGLMEKALGFARKAHKKNPSDSAMNYHLSLCYDALGEKDQALDMVNKLGDSPTWVDYYKFTLERDSGRHSEASETLLRIPSDYFQDPDELKAALDFARSRKDLVLLRHLKKRG